MTIDLGFAWMGLPSGQTVAFVDVPGHERFVPNMLAGVGPVPAAMIVVAADEGWMPQSAEHLAALHALDVRHGLLVVTRSDLAEPEAAIELAQAEIAGTSLGKVEAVAVSGVTGAGLDDLRAALDRLVQRLPAAEPEAPVRLWIDRVFTVKGAGTVVTGTLGAGRLRTGDELTLGDGTVRVRGLQTMGRQADEVTAVARVAVNLRGTPRDDLSRGDALLTPGRFRFADLIDVRIDGDPVAGLPAQATLHVGAAAVPAHIRPLGADTARLRLAHPLPLRIGDRALLRDPGRHHVAGGVTVLDVAPPGLKRRGAAAARAAQLTTMDGHPSLRSELTRRLLARGADLAAMGVPLPTPADSPTETPATKASATAGPAPRGLMPTGPAVTTRGDTTPARAARAGTAPAGTAPAGTAPAGTAPAGGAPAGIGPAGTAGGGAAPGGTGRSGTTPGRTGRGGTALGGAVPAGTARGGAVPGGTGRGGTAPDGAAPAGGARGGTPRGGAVPGGTGRGGAAPGGAVPAEPAPPRPVVGDWYVDAEHWAVLGGRLVDEVAAYAKAQPLEPGMPVEALRHRLGLPDRALVTALVKPPVTIRNGRVVGGASGAPDELVALVGKAFDGLGAFAAPEAYDLAALGLGARQVAAAERTGLLLRLTPQVVLRAGAVEEAVRVLAALPQPFTLSEARQALGTTRRVAVPLLELLDRKGRTRREPDDRRTIAS
ncbi:Elongation factor SelB, winged helix [Paractinoplanes atraurantiacus]|uniref:Elongation factor SelB, winged helix n=2 Tax=Paractinoplanes atraurantiacus TaxID=1036182 RepID=A0A285KLM7_9ACTN|nr:Elongation factor SelB, winged helix [Actinoplanes atraurantiacus]